MSQQSHQKYFPTFDKKENLTKKLNAIEHKNDLLSEKLNFDFLDTLIREKLKFGYSEEIIIKLNE